MNPELTLYFDSRYHMRMKKSVETTGRDVMEGPPVEYKYIKR